jgi:hypothetical protein
MRPAENTPAICRAVIPQSRLPTTLQGNILHKEILHID